MNAIYQANKINKEVTQRELFLLRQLADKVELIVSYNSCTMSTSDLVDLKQFIKDIKIANI